MAFLPITNISHLPQEGSSYETSTFDMKEAIRKMEMEAGRVRFNSFEMAKDIASFANAMGGTILIGAAEYRKTGNLVRYLPLPEAEAKEIRDEYGRASSQRCMPVPLIEPAIIAKDSGFVVAINVWPFPTQVVGVRLRGDKTDGYGDDVYVFPLRSGIDTTWVRPEQLPMLMLPELRRIVVLLEAIPPAERTNIKIHASIGSHPQRATPGDAISAIIGFDLLSNGIELQLSSKQGGKRQNFRLPLDVVKSVWKDASGIWCIALGGMLGEDLTYWLYT